MFLSIQLKQNRYRVALLASENVKSHIEEEYLDPRASSLKLAIAFAQSMFIEGLSLQIDNVIYYPQYYVSYIRSRNLSLFLWGNKLNNYSLINRLRLMGVNMFICNK